ncbi:DnaJ domain-containing protein [Chamaesiphon sp. VAR_48_metabat_403]|uniref:J domain-containing protein n=1 Tax=Chamaesiphon sp. VAR_48_metabat_403 TaxID=2964700 RepID=UPI00286D8569|nr:DnaJ domain-containing protein [Chamaesiphon sp. VAR_48_metabat_403]
MLASTTNLDKCYQLLGICRGASLDELKAAYRSLARKLHPDLNPGDTDAHQRFIALNQAYKILLVGVTDSIAPSTPTSQSNPKVDRRPPPAANTKPTQTEDELKWQLYYELQSLLKQQQFLKAIVLIEGLAHHSPQDRQVCQWQGIIYSQYGHQLIQRREFEKARSYLKKAIRVDPHNRQLWQEVDRAFNRIIQLS